MMGKSLMYLSRMTLGGKNSPESAHSANDRRNILRFAGEKARGVEENENIVLEKRDDFEAEVRHG